MLTIADVIEALIRRRPAWAGHVIADTVIDSRQAIPGCLFVALPGECVNGHDFVNHAFERGAYIAIIDRDIKEEFPVLDLRKQQSEKMPPRFTPPFCILVDNCLDALQQIARFWRRKLSIRVIGVTGSVGKSTTKELITEVLNQRFRTLKNQGNLNNEIGLPLTILRLDGGYEKAVLEMGFYIPGEIEFLCDIALPQVGVITNIGMVHAERAGSQGDIARGKAELVQALPAAPEGVAILNFDDPFVREMADLTQAQVFFYGLDSNADLWADNVEGLGLEGIRFRLHFQNEVLHLKVPLIGRHSVHTVLRSTAVGLIEGLTWQEIVSGLRSKQAQLRLAAVRTLSGALILDDTYNASPQSTLAALNLLAELEGHKVAVLGDMLELGQYERQGHEMVGLRVSQIVDELITVGERARIIADVASKSGLSPQVIRKFNNSQEVIEYLSDRLCADDVVLIKGSRGVYLDRIVNALEIVQ